MTGSPPSSDSAALEPGSLLSEHWQAVPAAEARERLKAEHPLSNAEAAERLATLGYNRLPEAAASGPLARDSDHYPGHWCAPDGSPQGRGPAYTGHRNPGCGVGDLFRQDRNPHP